MEKVPYLGQNLLRWESGPSTFLALPEKGARLMNWNVRLGDGSVRDVISWPELKSIDEVAKCRGGNPILFPFSGRSFDNGTINQWRTPEGRSLPMPIHGLARQSDFKITRLDGRGFAAMMLPGEEAKASYPYDYEFEVTYRFEPFGLTCEMRLRNLGKQPIPWSAGHHFYFTVPWREGLQRSDYKLSIPSSRTLVQDMAGTGKLLPGPVLAAEESLENPALIDVFHLGLKSNTVVLQEKSGGSAIRLKIGTTRVPNPDHAVVTWSADATSPFYCVEPWMGPANGMENKLGLQWVAPGQTQSFIVEVALT